MGRFLTCPTPRPQTHAADVHPTTADIIAIGGANTQRRGAGGWRGAVNIDCVLEERRKNK